MQTIEEVLEEIAQAARHAEQARPVASAPDPGPGLAANMDPPSDRRARHEPFRNATADWAALSACDDLTFIHDIYQIVLGRSPEASAVLAIRKGLASGTVDRLAVAQSLISSEEAKGRAVSVRGLGTARQVARLKRLPGIGRIAATLTAIARLPWHLAVLERRLGIIEERQKRIIADLDTFGAGAAAVHSSIKSVVSVIEQELVDLQSATQNHQTLNEQSQVRISELKVFAEARAEEAKATHRKTLREAAALTEMVSALNSTSAQGAGTAIATATAAIDDHALDDLYLAFENRFRGSPETIAARCERYVPMMTATSPVAAGHIVLDIGCGRGEWLSLLTAQGHACRGIDLNVAMVAAARERGHDVVLGDAISYLRDLPDNSLGAITGFHIVEHLPFRVLIDLLDQASRTLKPGGAILFETPNPECLIVGACNFYYDPTHQNPLPPELMRFLAEARTFSSARIVRSDSDCELSRPESGFTPVDVNSWFQAPMDYAIYAQKA
mgnify:CR=1 FL=1